MVDHLQSDDIALFAQTPMKLGLPIGCGSCFLNNSMDTIYSIDTLFMCSFINVLNTFIFQAKTVYAAVKH